MFFILLFNTINGFNIDLVDEVYKYSNVNGSALDEVALFSNAIVAVFCLVHAGQILILQSNYLTKIARGAVFSTYYVFFQIRFPLFIRSM